MAGTCDGSKWQAFVGSGSPDVYSGAFGPSGTVAGSTVTIPMTLGFTGSGSQRAKFLDSPSDVRSAAGNYAQAQNNIPLSVV